MGGESVHTKQNSYQAQNINYAENIHTQTCTLKIIISYKFYNVCFLFLRSQSRTKILAYQKICTFTIRTKIFFDYESSRGHILIIQNTFDR